MNYFYQMHRRRRNIPIVPPQVLACVNVLNVLNVLEVLAQVSRREFNQGRQEVQERLEQTWADLAHSGLEGLEGDQEIHASFLAMANSLDRYRDFSVGWNVNRQTLLNSMRNCQAFQTVLPQLQG